ncbi:MAG TPA: FGGY family carbohydrate kinase [Acidimicrobiales bacterium]|nr:FGGY family carbohydrate kinase [Acidimicrobiales bacterium]
MATECVVAVDIGTQSSRAALVDAAGVVRDAQSSPIDLFGSRPGWAEQDPEQWWGTTVANIAAVTGRNPEVEVVAVGVGAQMYSLVAIDQDGCVVGGRSAIWSDKRCAEQVDEFLARPDCEELSVLAGNRPLPAWSGFKMAWLRRYMPDAYHKAHRLLVAKDFVNFRISGEAVTDPSESSGSFLCDASTGKWSDQLIEALGLDRSKLPEIVASSSVIGKVGKAAAEQTGLPGGTPVVGGSGDMMCQLLASGLTRSGRVTVVSGTSSIVATAAAQPSADPRVMNLRLATGDWARFGIGDAAGVSFRWFADHLCGAAPTSGPDQVRDLYDRLTAEAATVAPGSEGLLFFPYLLGERTLGSHLSRASFIGATLGHHRPHFSRAVMEGITLEDRRALECLCPDGFSGPVRCTGGGATSSLWNQIRADIFAHPVQTLSTTEGGTQGAAILAGVGAGWYPDAAAGAEDVVRPADTWEPDEGAVRDYDEVFRTFCAVHDALGPEWQHWG